MWRKRPSELLNLDDEYAAYCLDEVCAIIVTNARDKRMPRFKPTTDDDKTTTNAALIEQMTRTSMKRTR